jgi:hypothetical protein
MAHVYNSSYVRSRGRRLLWAKVRPYLKNDWSKKCWEYGTSGQSPEFKPLGLPTIFFSVYPSSSVYHILYYTMKPVNKSVSSSFVSHCSKDWTWRGLWKHLIYSWSARSVGDSLLLQLVSEWGQFLCTEPLKLWDLILSLGRSELNWIEL